MARRRTVRRRTVRRRTVRRTQRKQKLSRKLPIKVKKVKFTKDDKNKTSYILGYAKSGRSTCRACHTKIERGSVRLGSVGHIYDREAIFWRHFPDCVSDNIKHNIKTRGHVDIILSPEDTKKYTKVLKSFK